MSQLLTVKKISFVFALILTIGFYLPNEATAQGFGYGGGGFGYGGGGFGGPGLGGGGLGGGQGQVTVKYGEIIYDAVFGDVIDYKVYFIPVPPDTIGVHYFDDGTNGDEVAYDGIPSNITHNRDTYLGPFSIQYKNILQNAINAAQRMDALEFYDFNVIAESPDSLVQNENEAEDQMQSVLDGLRSRLAQFEGYNDERYVKAVDPSLFESQEGFGATGGGLGGGIGGGLNLPELPPPPGLPEYDIRGNVIGGEGQEDGGEPVQGQQQQQPQNPINRPIDQAMQNVGALEAQNALSP